MILDVARHKFFEGVLILAFTALTALVVALLPMHEGVSLLLDGGGVAPLRSLLNLFEMEHPVISALLILPIFVIAVLRLSRATVRFPLYPSATMASIAVSSLVILALLHRVSMLNAAVVALLSAETVGCLLGCFGPNIRPSRLFSAMFFLGAMPLFDASLAVVSIILPLLVIIVRGTLRETVISIVGVLAVPFAYCYVVWCFGGNFLDAAYHLYANSLLPSVDPLISYLTLPRLLLFGILLFMQLSASIFYFSERRSLNLAARNVWLLLQILVVMLAVSFVFLPSTSQLSMLVVVMILLPMLPMYFLRTPTVLSVLSFALLFVVSYAVLFVG